MALILLSVPGASQLTGGAASDQLPPELREAGPRVLGEATVGRWADMLLVDNVSYDIKVPSELHTEGRRTIHLPELSPVTLERKVDRASVVLTRSLLTTAVPEKPWQLFFFRVSGGEAPQVFMTMKLHRPLVRSQTVRASDQGPAETLVVGATSIEWEYTEYSTNQRPKGKTAFTFDIQAGQVS